MCSLCIVAKPKGYESESEIPHCPLKGNWYVIVAPSIVEIEKGRRKKNARNEKGNISGFAVSFLIMSFKTVQWAAFYNLALTLPTMQMCHLSDITGGNLF